MPYARRKKPAGRKAIVRKRNPKAARRRYGPSRALVHAIKQVNNRSSETKLKTVQFWDSQDVAGTGLAYALRRGATELNLLAGLALKQGVQQEERVGVQVSPVALTVAGFAMGQPFDSTTNISLYPYELHILVYKYKTNNQGVDTALLQYPDNTNGPILGLKETLYPFNRKAYVIKKHKVYRFKPLPSVAHGSIHPADPGPPPTDGTAPVLQNPSFSSALAVQYRRFKFSIPIKKVLDYNDQSNTPTNEWLSFAAYVINGDGADLSDAPPGVSLPAQTRVRITASVTLRFKDR